MIDPKIKTEDVLNARNRLHYRHNGKGGTTLIVYRCNSGFNTDFVKMKDQSSSKTIKL